MVKLVSEGRACTGRTYIVHDIDSGLLAAYRAVNVEGTQRLLRACVHAGVPRFIYLTLIKAMGERGHRVAILRRVPAMRKMRMGLRREKRKVLF